MDSRIIKKLDDITSRTKFKRYVELDCYDSANNFYAKVIREKIIIDCEVYSVSLDDNGSLSWCFFEYLPDLCTSSPSRRRYYIGNILELIRNENEKILEQIHNLNLENKLLDIKKQVAIDKRIKYSRILEKIKDNKSYNYRKFKKIVNKKLDGVLEKLDSRYFEHYNTSKYELAIKDNTKCMNRINKFIRRARINIYGCDLINI